MMKEARKSKEKKKAKVQKGGLRCETKEAQKNPTHAGKLRKQRNREDAEESLKMRKFKQSQAVINAQNQR